jgi:3-oxoacyl-[acyl-carrier-protein] synthase II
MLQEHSLAMLRMSGFAGGLELAKSERVLTTPKSFIGHAMGAAAALELAGNLPAFEDHWCHPTINLDHLDPACELPGLVANRPEKLPEVRTILNLSFGMLGINSAIIVRKI